MKNFFKGMDLNGTAQYVVQKKDKAMETFYFSECVLGDNEISLKAERKRMLCDQIIKWLLKKGAVLTCQDCGSVSNVKVIGDLRNCGTLCPDCLNKRLGRNQGENVA